VGLVEKSGTKAGEGFGWLRETIFEDYRETLKKGGRPEGGGRLKCQEKREEESLREGVGSA